MSIETFLIELVDKCDINIELTEDGKDFDIVASDEDYDKYYVGKRQEFVRANISQILEYLNSEAKQEYFVIRSESLKYPMLFKEGAGMEWNNNNPAKYTLIDNYFTYTEMGIKYYTENLPDYNSTHNLYSDKFKQIIDNLGLEYELAKPVYVYSNEKKQEYLYWGIVPKTINCLDREKTVALRNAVDNSQIVLHDKTDFFSISDDYNRVVLDKTKIEGHNFFRLGEHAFYHIIPYEIKEKLQKYEFIGVKFIATKSIKHHD